jgi:hypothetical protein
MERPPLLDELQHGVQAHVIAGDAGALDWIGGNCGIAANLRLGVYAEAYRLRLAEVLENDFPALLAWLGAVRFEALARDYIDAHPSTGRSVRWFGNAFPALVAARRTDDPVAGELAEFEWTKGAAFDAADAACVGIEAMAALAPEDWPGTGFALHPSLRVQVFDARLPVAWEALTDDPPRAPPEPEGIPVTWRVWRDGLAVRWCSMEDDETGALEAVAAGADFATLCERLCAGADADAAPLRAAALLKRWLDDGLVTALCRRGDG